MLLITFIDKAVANFFTPTSKKEPDRLVWRVVDDSLLIGTYTPKSDEPRSKRTKIAAFDLVRIQLPRSRTACFWLSNT